MLDDVTAQGRVREWHDDLGWGVVDVPGVPGGCWVHFSVVLVDGLHTLRVGQQVEVVVEEVEQDGYAFRAAEAWPVGQEPVRRAPEGPSVAYSSTLNLTFDEPDPS